MKAIVIRVLAILALVAMPIGMARAGAAVTASPAMAMDDGHCRDTQQPDSPMPPMDDCVACGAIAPLACGADEPCQGPLAALFAFPPAPFLGIAPDPVIPPPRSA